MPLNNSDFPAQPIHNRPRRRALTNPLPLAPWAPPAALLEYVAVTRKHLNRPQPSPRFGSRKAILHSQIYPIIQTTNNQPCSPLFNKLPREVRDQIWELLIESYSHGSSPPSIHIWSAWDHEIDRDRILLDEHRTYIPQAILDAGVASNRAVLKGLFSLLRACRLTYSEIIVIWYKKATFSFQSVNYLNAMFSSRSRCDPIQHLSIFNSSSLERLSPESRKRINKEHWRKACTHMSSMPCLKTLNIDLRRMPVNLYNTHGLALELDWRDGWVLEYLCLVEQPLETFLLHLTGDAKSVIEKLLNSRMIDKIPFTQWASDGLFTPCASQISGEDGSLEVGTWKDSNGTVTMRTEPWEELDTSE